jgi:hypothetical protein
MPGARSPAGQRAEGPFLLNAPAGSSFTEPAGAPEGAETEASAVAQAAATANDDSGTAGASPTSTAAHAAAILLRIYAPPSGAPRLATPAKPAPPG